MSNNNINIIENKIIDYNNNINNNNEFFEINNKITDNNNIINNIEINTIITDELYFHKLNFSLLYLISILVVCISSVYYYSLNNYNNRIYLSTNDLNINSNFPIYKIISKYTEGNKIFIELKLEYENKKSNNKILYDNLKCAFIFYSDTVNIKIFSNENNNNNINNSNQNQNNINNYKESNIGIKILDYPFSFKLYRKEDNSILFNSECSTYNNNIFFSVNYIQLCQKIYLKDYFYIGFENEYTTNINNILKQNEKYLLLNKKGDNFPFYLTYNKNNYSSYGILLMSNDGLLKIDINNEEMNYELINDNSDINFFIFNGVSVKEVIIQLQNYIGMPTLPSYYILDWNYLNERKKFFVNNIIDLDEGLNGIVFNDVNIDNNINNNDIIIDDGNYSLFLNMSVKSDILNEFNFIQLLQNNSFIMNYINIINILESKHYYLNSNLLRPLIFSTKSSIVSNRYAYKWFKNVSFSYNDLVDVVNKIKIQSLYGNPFFIIEFNNNNNDFYEYWLQLLALMPIVDFNGFNNDSNIIEYKNLRYTFSLYLYSYFVIVCTEGGSIIRPIYFDLKTITYINDVITNNNQIMIGSNIMIYFNNFTNNKISNKNYSILLPNEKFYDFYTGEYINKNGEGYYSIKVSKHLPIFLRGGKITPVQLYDNNYNDYDINNINMNIIKSKPIQLIISLDYNNQASGKIYLDDFYSLDSKNKKIYYKMLISVSQTTIEMSIFFKVYNFKYKLKNNLFNNEINRIIIYGFSKISIKKITIMNKNGRQLLNINNIERNNNKDIFIIKDISIPLDMDSKMLIL